MNEAIEVTLSQRRDYQFDIAFAGGAYGFLGDEPAPLGRGEGPGPAQLLVAAVGNCVSDSLLFALRKFGLDAEPLSARARGFTARNERGRLRVQRVEVEITLAKAAADLQHLDRVLGQFKDFCTVTQSVQPCIDVVVAVIDSTGQEFR